MNINVSGYKVPKWCCRHYTGCKNDQGGKTIDASSLTWTAHIKLLFRLNSLLDLFTLISGSLLPKEKWKVITKTAIVAYYEKT